MNFIDKLINLFVSLEMKYWKRLVDKEERKQKEKEVKKNVARRK